MFRFGKSSKKEISFTLMNFRNSSPNFTQERDLKYRIMEQIVYKDEWG